MGLGAARGDQRALRWEDDVEDLAHTFVDVDLGGSLRRIREIAQNGSDPFDQERAIRVIRRPVDWTGGLRIGPAEIERDVLTTLDHLEGEPVQPGLAYSVVLDIVLPGIFAVRDLGDELAAIDVAALVENRLKAALNWFASEPGEQAFHPARAHHTGFHLAVEVGRQHRAAPRRRA